MMSGTPVKQCTPCATGVGGILAVAAGAVKVGLSVAGVGLAPPEVIEARREVCRRCDRAEPCPNNPAKRCKCSECGCFLVHKTRLASESCPLPEPKWSPHRA